MRCYGISIPGSEQRFWASGGESGVGPAHGEAALAQAFPRATLREGLVMEVSFYDLLGIPESGSITEIKSAYKQLARKYHPDVLPPDRVEEHTKRFIQLQEAYETLSDPSRRAMYDRDMAKGISFAFGARRRYNYHDQVMSGSLLLLSRIQMWRVIYIELQTPLVPVKGSYTSAIWRIYSGAKFN